MYQICVMEDESPAMEWSRMLENDEIDETEEAFMIGWMGAYEEEW